MLVNKVSPATLCPQQQEPTHNQFQRSESAPNDESSQYTQYSQTSLDLFSQPQSSSQGYYSMSDDVAEGGKRQRNDSCGSLSFEEEAHYKTQPTDQSSKYYTRYLSLPSAYQARSDRHVQAQAVITNNSSYEHWLSKRQDSMRGITDSVISTTKDCVKEIGSVLDDLKAQLHEQLKQTSHIDDSWRREHTSLLEQQRTILSQLMEGQLQIQQDLADIKQFNTEVCARFGSLEGTMNGVCELVKQIVQQASPTVPQCCLDCKKQVMTKDFLETQQRIPAENDSIQHTTGQDQQVPGDESSTCLITKQLSSEHKPIQFLHLNSAEENFGISYSRMVDQSSFTYAHINNCRTKENYHASAVRILADRNSSAQNNALSLVVPTPSPHLKRQTRTYPLRKGRGRQRAVERSRPKTSMRRSKRHCNVSDNETPVNKRSNYGTSKSPIIIDDTVFLKSPMLKEEVPEPKLPPSSFQKSSELERRKAFISQSMTPGSQVLMMEIASSLKEQIQKGHHAFK